MVLFVIEKRPLGATHEQHPQHSRTRDRRWARGGYQPAAASSTGDRKLAKAFGLEGDSWMKHANPASVWTRFTVVSLFALAVWSRDWIGIWCLIPIALSIVWMFVNPLFFKEPRSTRNWASRAVLGERIWVDRDKVELPEQFRSQRPRWWPTATRPSAWDSWPTAWWT